MTEIWSGCGSPEHSSSVTKIDGTALPWVSSRAALCHC